MKKAPNIHPSITIPLRTLLALAVFSLVFIAANSSFAYPRYKNDAETAGSNCSACHGDFTDATSTKGSEFLSDNKHEMHRNSSAMNATCNLCHTSGDSRNPYLGSSNPVGDFDPGLGCSGCHEGLGLRAHHAANGITTCATVGCHDSDGPAPAEGTIITTNSYYGVTALSNVDNPCNDSAVANTNENWTIGDFVGLDNDGDNLYDFADFDCGPPYHIVGIEVIGNDIQISWETVGGRKDILQASSNLTNTFSDVGSVVTNSGSAFVTNSVLEVGGAGSTNRFYRIQNAP